LLSWPKALDLNGEGETVNPGETSKTTTIVVNSDSKRDYDIVHDHGASQVLFITEHG
jgi:hypothetical protein